MRCYHEGALGSLLIAGIQLAFALSLVLPNDGAIPRALSEHGLAGEWAFVCIGAAILTFVGICCPKTVWRKASFKVNAFVNSSSYAMVLFYAANLSFSPFGNVLLVASFGSLALLWLDEREGFRKRPRAGKENHARQA